MSPPQPTCETHTSRNAQTPKAKLPRKMKRKPFAAAAPSKVTKKAPKRCTKKDPLFFLDGLTFIRAVDLHAYIMGGENVGPLSSMQDIDR